MELASKKEQGMTNKETLAKFVHDVADMEVRAFTLRETAKRIRMDAIKKKQELEAECHNRKHGLEQINDILGTARNKRRDETEKLKFHWVKPLFAALGRGILVSFLGNVLLGSLYQNGGLKISESVFIAMYIYISLGIAVLFSFLFFILKLLAHKRAVKHTISPRISELTTEIDTLEKKRYTANQSFLSSQDELSKFEHKTIPALFDHADSLEKDAKLIEERIRQCYSLNIIKPAYQNLVSVVILDEVFVNDKADTMREAMLLCDTELRHSELIGKLDKVIDALQTLATTLQHMNSVLDSINTNVSMISQDVYKMSQSQDRIAYAAESIKKSADNADFYIA